MKEDQSYGLVGPWLRYFVLFARIKREDSGDTVMRVKLPA